MGSRRYIVETRSMLNDWENCWMDDEDKPVVFHSKKEAKESLDLFLKEEQEAYERGFIQDEYSLEDYRVRRVDNAKD